MKCWCTCLPLRGQRSLEFDRRVESPPSASRLTMFSVNFEKHRHLKPLHYSHGVSAGNVSLHLLV